MYKRKIAPYKATQLHYVLFFLREENKYFVISSASTIYPKDLDIDAVKVLQQFKLKDSLTSFPAIYICHSESKSEMETKMSKMQSYIESGRTIDADSSMRFLRESFNLSPAKEQSVDITESPESDCEPSGSQCMQVPSPGISDAILKAIERGNSLLEEILKEQRKLRRNLVKKCHADQKDRTENSDEVPAVLEPVMFEGVNLTSLASRNLCPSNFGLLIARKLWSDDELKSQRLRPQRSTGRPPLSPNRSVIFEQSVLARFPSAGADALSEATAAINQLGNDLKSGKRSRKMLEM